MDELAATIERLSEKLLQAKIYAELVTEQMATLKIQHASEVKQLESYIESLRGEQ